MFTANGMRSLTPTIDRRTIVLPVMGQRKRERSPVDGAEQRVISRRIAGERSSDLIAIETASRLFACDRRSNIQGAAAH